MEWTAKCRTTRVLQWGNVSSDMLSPLPRLQTAARGAQAQARCRRHKTGTHQIRSAPAPICNSTYYILPHTRPPHLHQTPQLPKPYELTVFRPRFPLLFSHLLYSPFFGTSICRPGISPLPRRSDGPCSTEPKRVPCRPTPRPGTQPNQLSSARSSS